MLAEKSLDEFDPAPPDVAGGLPEASHRFAPASAEEASAMLRSASRERAIVQIQGHGTRQGMGGPLDPDIVMSTAAMDQIVAWEPDDLTLVVEPGVAVNDIESELATRNQTAGLPEWDGAGTVGGVVATASSGYRRARLGPIRDRMLQVEIVTGDGRVVHGGGRVVKNVSGYDLPRLATGSMGRLGLITSVCLKLWPLPEAAATILFAGSPAEAWHRLYRPLAVLETRNGAAALVQGTVAEVRSQVRALGGDVVDDLQWPPPPSGAFACSIRVRPADLSEVLTRLPADWRFVAQHGVGVVDAGCDEPDPDDILVLRQWAEQRGGTLVVVRSGPVDLDPWGTPPSSLGLQQRIIAGFDPHGTVNPGRLPGRI